MSQRYCCNMPGVIFTKDLVFLSTTMGLQETQAKVRAFGQQSEETVHTIREMCRKLDAKCSAPSTLLYFWSVCTHLAVMAPKSRAPFNYNENPKNWTKAYISQGLGIEGNEWKSLMESAYALLKNNDLLELQFDDEVAKDIGYAAVRSPYHPDPEEPTKKDNLNLYTGRCPNAYNYTSDARERSRCASDGRMSC